MELFRVLDSFMVFANNMVSYVEEKEEQRKKDTKEILNRLASIENKLKGGFKEAESKKEEDYTSEYAPEANNTENGVPSVIEETEYSALEEEEESSEEQEETEEKSAIDEAWEWKKTEKDEKPLYDSEQFQRDLENNLDYYFHTLSLEEVEKEAEEHKVNAKYKEKTLRAGIAVASAFWDAVLGLKIDSHEAEKKELLKKQVGALFVKYGGEDWAEKYKIKEFNVEDIAFQIMYDYQVKFHRASLEWLKKNNSVLIAGNKLEQENEEQEEVLELENPVILEEEEEEREKPHKRRPVKVKVKHKRKEERTIRVKLPLAILRKLRERRKRSNEI